MDNKRAGPSLTGPYCCPALSFVTLETKLFRHPRIIRVELGEVIGAALRVQFNPRTLHGLQLVRRLAKLLDHVGNRLCLRGQPLVAPGAAVDWHETVPLSLTSRECVLGSIPEIPQPPRWTMSAIVFASAVSHLLRQRRSKVDIT